MKEKKFTQVFNKYNKLVRKIVLDRTGNWNLAEEICQQVFLNYFQNMDNLENNMIQPWLVRCTKNMVNDYYRKQRIHNNIVEMLSEMEIIRHDNAEKIIRNMVGSQLMNSIMDELYEYKREWHDIIEAVCIFEMSYEEAAKHLGMKPQTLRAKLFRARRYIRKKFGEEYEKL